MNYTDSLIRTLDLGPIKYKLVNPEKDEPWSIKKVNMIEEKYRHFLFLNLKYPDKTIVPDEEVDQFWHTHILDTMKYAEDCDLVFGRFLHHFPYFGIRDEQDAKNLQSAYNESVELLKLEFGFDLELTGSKCSGCGGSTCGSSTCQSKISNYSRPTLA